MTSAAQIVNPATGLPLPGAAAAGGATTLAPVGSNVRGSTLGGPLTVKAPAAPLEGDCFIVSDADSHAGTNNLTIDGNGNLIDGAASVVLNVDGAFACLIFDRAQWRRLAPRRTLDLVPNMLEMLGDLADAPGAVGSVLAAAPITTTGGANPTIGITAATGAARGSMSSADKTKLDGLQKQGTTALAVQNPNVDWSLGGSWELTLVAAAACAMTFSNVLDGEIVLVKVIGNAAASFGFPAGILWVGGTVPTPTLNGVDLYTFTRIGATIIGSALTDVHV